MMRSTRLGTIGLWLFSIVAFVAPAAAQHPVRVLPNVPYLQGASYADDKGKLDLFVPADMQGFPVILMLHGGALRAGDKTSLEAVGRRFASEGVGMAVTNYRLSPTVMHPGHIEDVAAAFAWLKANVAEHGGDPSQLFVMGHSAGAYMAALLVLDDRYLQGRGVSVSDVRGSIPLAGFFYVDRIAADRPKDVWGTEESAWVAASPHTYLEGASVPMLLIYADGDDEWRRAQNDEFTDALRAAGLAHVRREEVADRTHGTLVSRLADEQDSARTLVIQFVKQIAGGGTE